MDDGLERFAVAAVDIADRTPDGIGGQLQPEQPLCGRDAACVGMIRLVEHLPRELVAESLDPAILRKPAEFEGHFDPHVWMDVSLWSQCVEAVAKGMSEHDLPHASEYAERATAYRQELVRLDEYTRKVIASIPEEQRVLVTAHDAFGYFARAYGMQVKSVQGISTESEAGVADINSLVDFLVERKIGAIFVESSVSDKGLRAVIEGRPLHWRLYGADRRLA